MSVTTAVFQQGKRMRFLWLAVELVHDGRAGWVRARVVDSFFGK